MLTTKTVLAFGAVAVSLASVACFGTSGERTSAPVARTSNGSVVPEYAVLSVLYSPPGSALPEGVGVVDYSASRSTGTSTNISSAFLSDDSVSGEGGGVFGGLSITTGTPSADGSAQTNDVDMTLTEVPESKVSGPNADGIDHDQDRILVWIHPVVDAKVTAYTPSFAGQAVPATSVVWTLSNGSVQSVSVQCLKNPSAAGCANSVTSLTQAGITQTDYPTLLARDPFAEGQVDIDATRFEQLASPFAYDPTDGPNGTMVSITSTLTHPRRQDPSPANIDVFAVPLVATGGVDASVVLAQLKSSATFPWTNTTTWDASADNTQSASATVGQPSSSYTGPTFAFVYYDTIYNTFLFALKSL
jgi:hypothetical protein